jgi:hypothetical protein
MKKGGLARALQARKALDDQPDSESKREVRPRATAPALPKSETEPKAKAQRRFHTTIYPDSKESYDEIRIALIREGKGRDFNRLVNDLLNEWLEAHGD